MWREARERAAARHPGFVELDDPKLRVQRVANELIGACIVDLIESSHASIEESGVRESSQVQAHDRLLVRHGARLGEQVAELQAFLYRRFYRHPHLERFLVYAREVLSRLFEAYRARPEELSPWYRSWAEEVGLEQAICDYLAGMTDRFVQEEVGRLVDPELAQFPRSG